MTQNNSQNPADPVMGPDVKKAVDDIVQDAVRVGTKAMKERIKPPLHKRAWPYTMVAGAAVATGITYMVMDDPNAELRLEQLKKGHEVALEKQGLEHDKEIAKLQKLGPHQCSNVILETRGVGTGNVRHVLMVPTALLPRGEAGIDEDLAYYAQETTLPTERNGRKSLAHIANANAVDCRYIVVLDAAKLLNEKIRKAVIAGIGAVFSSPKHDDKSINELSFSFAKFSNSAGKSIMRVLAHVGGPYNPNSPNKIGEFEIK